MKEVTRLQAELQAQRLAVEEEADRTFRAEQMRKRAEVLAERAEAEKVRGDRGNLRIRKGFKTPPNAWRVVEKLRGGAHASDSAVTAESPLHDLKRLEP